MSRTPLPGAPPEGCLRLVMVGDVVGKPGMRIACAAVPWLRSAIGADAIVVNAENAADGSGLRCKDYRRLIDSGVDGVTLGDHLYRKRELIEVLQSESRIVRPANLPPEAPGATRMVLTLADGQPIAVMCALGRVFMKPVDCPFRAVERELDALDPEIKVRLVDFHAEATSDKQLMGRFLDGRVSAVLGTHTHVPTADECILPGGTAFQCDVGMTGPFDGILGRRTDAVLESTLHAIPIPYHIGTADVRLNGTWVDVDRATGRCRAIGRIDVAEEALG